MGKMIWVVHGSTESGDEYIFAFEDKPTEEEIEAVFSEQMTLDWEDDYIPAQSWTLTETELR